MSQVSRAFPTSGRWVTIRKQNSMMASRVPPTAEGNRATRTHSVVAKDAQSSVSGDKLSEDELELHLWQRAFFLDDGSSVRHSADSLRLRLAHLHYCCTKEQSAGGSTLYLQHVMGDYLHQYGRLVDGSEEDNKGLDNLTAAAKVLSTGHRRDCRSWKSSLTMESMMEIPEVQAAMKAEQCPDKPLVCVRRPLPLVSLSPPGSRDTVGPSTSQQGLPSKPVQRPPTSPYRVFSKTAGQQTSQNSSHAPPRGGPGVGPHYLFHAQQPPGHRNTPVSFPYSSSAASNSSGSGMSSSTGQQRRGKGWMAGGYCNEEGRPHSKRARMSTVVVADDEDTEHDKGKALDGRANMFITARNQHVINQQKKYGRAAAGGGGTGGGVVNSGNYGTSKRSLGTRRGFVPPIKRDQDEGGSNFGEEVRSRVLYGAKGSSKGSSDHQLPPELEGDERLRNIEPRMVELITNEIMDHGAAVLWDDIAGLHFAKATIKEIVVWPMLRPDIFKGLRGPPKGILLFGPPGTGKTLIGKCVASQVQATFFSISASSLTSKWVGEGEKMVRALFAVARCYQPAVIFIDEIDSLLSQRSDTEHESSRRIKTEFLVQLDGATTNDEDRLLVIGATNRPQEIDEAARRRLVKRLYIPLPDAEARKQIVSNLMKQQPFSLSEDEMEELCKRSEGYSGADMANLCREAAYGPVREAAESIQHIAADEMRPVLFKDFESAFCVIRPSVSDKDLGLYIEWNRQFGCGTK